VKGTFQGKEVELTEVEVLQCSEQWNEYQLSDGKILLLKTVLVGIQRIEEQTQPDGSPVYQFLTHSVPRIRR